MVPAFAAKRNNFLKPHWWRCWGVQLIKKIHQPMRLKEIIVQVKVFNKSMWYKMFIYSYCLLYGHLGQALIQNELSNV